MLMICNYLLEMIKGSMIRELRGHLPGPFDIKDLGATKYVWGMEINKDWVNIKLWLIRKKYANTIF